MISPSSSPAKIVQISDPDTLIRKSVLTFLGELGDPRLIELLIEVLSSDPSDEMRKQAAILLGEQGDLRAVEPLLVALGDPNVHVCLQASHALNQLKARYTPRFTEAAPGDQPSQSLLEAASSTNLLDESHVIAALRTTLEHKEAEVRQLAITELVRIGKQQIVIDFFAAELETRLTSLRLHASAVLEVLNSKERAALNRKSPPFQGIAAKAMESLDPERMIESLRTVLSSGPMKARFLAIRLLGRSHHALASEPLLTMLRDPDWRVRKEAASALGELGNARAIEPLSDALGDASISVRIGAIDALGALKDARAVEPLLAILSAAQPATRDDPGAR